MVLSYQFVSLRKSGKKDYTEGWLWNEPPNGEFLQQRESMGKQIQAKFAQLIKYLMLLSVNLGRCSFGAEKQVFNSLQHINTTQI